MKRPLKITVKHFLHKKVRPVNGEYPIYLRVIYNKESTMLRSTYAEGKYSSLDEVAQSLLAKEADSVKKFIRSREVTLMSAKEILKAYAESTKEAEDKELSMLKSFCNELLLAYSKSKRIKRPLRQFNQKVEKHLT